MDTALEALISAGPLGAIIVVLFVAYWRQGKALGEALKEAQEARVQDAQKVTKDLLELNEKWLVAINALTSAVDQLRVAVSSSSRRDRGS